MNNYLRENINIFNTQNYIGGVSDTGYEKLSVFLNRNI